MMAFEDSTKEGKYFIKKLTGIAYIFKETIKEGKYFIKKIEWYSIYFQRNYSAIILLKKYIIVQNTLCI